jgi:cell division protein YceG involved in septum cleavage
MADMSWRNDIRRFVRDVMAGDAATAAANAITNVKSAITSRLRRGTTTVPPVTTVSQPELPRLSQQPLVTVPVVNYQPRSLRAIAGERVLGDDRYNASLFKVEDGKTAMNKNCVNKKITSTIPMDESTFLTKAKITVCNRFEQHRNTKVKLKYICSMTRTDMGTGEEQTKDGVFWSGTFENDQATDLNDMYNTMKDRLLEELTNYLNEGSNWRFKEVKCLEVLIDKNHPLRGSSYKVLPKFVQNKKAVINI